ncbi:MAG: carboxymuconolactone decarboxylase family protein [Luteolibacter sp.]
MQPRFDYSKADPAGYQAVLKLEMHIRNSGIDPTLWELVKLRASQINGCAYCIDMHSKEARGKGETEQRIYLLNAWRESPLYTDAERAVLAWTEAVTLISQTHAPDEVYEELARHFSEEQITQITIAIGMINLWNRLAISFRAIHPVAHA